MPDGTAYGSGSVRQLITRALATPARAPGWDADMTPCMALEDLWI
ncbi:MAG TPA: hypothetical protein VF070_19070 [Streptosporangiaceae bacterium]